MNKSLSILALVLFFVSTTQAQVKLGSNPNTIDANANLQIEGTDGSQTIIRKDNGRFGVGILNPTERLDVVGNVKFSGALMPNNLPGVAGQVLTSAGAGAAPTWSAVSTSNIYSGDGSLSGNRTVSQGTNTLAFTSAATTGSNHFSVDGATFSVNALSNRVGIGTTNPGFRLNIVNDNQNIGEADDIVFESYNSSVAPALAFSFLSSRGTKAAPINLQSGDLLADLFFGGRWNNQDNGFANNSFIRTHYRGNGATNLTDMMFATSGNIRMTLNQDGRLGIGTEVPDQALTVNGNASKNSGGTSWAVFSDMRLKENVVSYTRGLAEIMQINPIYFNYTDNSGKKLNDIQTIGISAQEVQKVIPEAISTKESVTLKDGTVLSNVLELTQADAMWLAAINAIKELNVKIEALQAENTALKVSNSELKASIENLDKIKGEIDSIKALLSSTLTNSVGVSK